MLKYFVDTIKRSIKPGFLQRLIQMAEKTETSNLGEKRAATSSPEHQSKKKKKAEHVGALGKSEGFKRKVALLVAYNGAGYYGVQINRGFKTIESELFSAMVTAETVPQDHVDNLPKMWFQRGSRTDKGVSAVGQIFSLKLCSLYYMVIVPDVIAKLNESLPEQIRVFGYIRTTNGFDSKNFCCGRTYMYMAPTLAFAPLEKFVTDDYRITEDRLDQVRHILSTYVGTHKFHNFTSGVKYEQASASRYIISFECSDPYVRDGIEFVTLRVRGQSFMLHQIRKMIGLTIAILRGFSGEAAIAKSWEADRMDIPKAPGLGLVLEALHFDGYNKKFGKDGVHEPVEWSAYQSEMDEFKEKHIISYIVEQEKKDKVMLNWLQTLQFHNFDVTRPEGPQKPWVKMTKLLLESHSSSNDSKPKDLKENDDNDKGDNKSLQCLDDCTTKDTIKEVTSDCLSRDTTTGTLSTNQQHEATDDTSSRLEKSQSDDSSLTVQQGNQSPLSHSQQSEATSKTEDDPLTEPRCENGLEDEKTAKTLKM